MKATQGEIARRYATALVELAQEQGKLVEVLEEARRLMQIWNDVETVFVSPLFVDEQKNELLNAMVRELELQPLMFNTLRLVLRNRRMKFLPDIIKEYQNRVDELMGVARATFVSARPVDGATIVEFEEALSRRMGKKVYLAQKIDESVRAGYILRIGNTVIDASLKTHLERLRESLSQGV